MLLAKGCILSIKSGAEHHPCCSGLQVQGTAKSPAARKLYDVFGIVDQTIFFSIALFFGFVNVFVAVHSNKKPPQRTEFILKA